MVRKILRANPLPKVASVARVAAILEAIQSLNDLSAAEVLAALTDDSTKFSGADIGNTLTALEFHSAQAEIVFTTATSVKSLPSVVLPNITVNSIEAAYIGYVLSGITNSFAGQNYLNGAPNLQVKESVSGSWTTGLAFASECWGSNPAASASNNTRGGRVIGNVDVKAQIAAFNKTYNFQLTSIASLQNNLETRGFNTFILLLVRT